jgi:hypothetical protein
VLGCMSIGLGLVVIFIVLGYVWISSSCTAMMALLTPFNILASAAAITPGVAAVVVALWLEWRR